MAKRVKTSDPSEPETDIIRVDDPLVDEPAEVEPGPDLPPPPASMLEDSHPNTRPPDPPREPPVRVASGPSFGQRVGGFFRFLFRLLLLLVALAVIGVALYYLLPLLYDQYVRPLEQNTVRVAQLQSRQEQTEQELADLQTRLATLEDLQNQQDQSLSDLDQRLNDVETEIMARTESLAALEKMQADFQAENETANTELERQLNLLKAMELLSRARLFMYQSNFGLARQDVQIARDVLASVQPDTPKALAPDLEAVIQRLDMTLFNLPNFPVAASDDLDIAWQILLTGLPEATPTLVETPTLPPTLAGTLSATPTALPTLTPTPAVTIPPAPT